MMAARSSKAWPTPDDDDFPAWVDGPRPELDAGRMDWMRARSLRAMAARKARGGRRRDALSGADKANEVQSSPLEESEAALLAIIRDARSLDTSKVAAARALSALRTGTEGSASSESDLWRERRRTLEALPLGQRLALLREALGLGTTPSTPSTTLEGYAEGTTLEGRLEGEGHDRSPVAFERSALASSGARGGEAPQRGAGTPAVSSGEPYVTEV